MKVVSSSTAEQEQEIAELVGRFYESVFPYYFREDEILHFRELGVLQPNKSAFTYTGTLRDAYQVMTCLQVLLSIMGNKHASERNYEELFMRNVTLLNEYGIFFPFSYRHFNHLQEQADIECLSMHSAQVANSYLV